MPIRRLEGREARGGCCGSFLGVVQLDSDRGVEEPVLSREMGREDGCSRLRGHLLGRVRRLGSVRVERRRRERAAHRSADDKREKASRP